MAQGDVLVVGDEVDHLIQRNQLDALAGTCADVAARPGTGNGGRSGQRRQLHAVGPLGLLQRLRQMLRAHRLDQVANRADLERLQGEFIMGSTKDHRRRRIRLAEPGCDLQAIEPGHADIQQHDIRAQFLDQRQCFFAIAGGRLEDTIAVEVTYQSAQALAG